MDILHLQFLGMFYPSIIIWDGPTGIDATGAAAITARALRDPALLRAHVDELLAHLPQQ